MTRYRYTTVDSRGKTVSGQIEAAGVEAAREKLAQLGIPEETVALEEIPTPASGGQRLSGEEAAQLAGQAANLAGSGLPLGAGLRALAEEIPRRRLQGVLRRIADHVDAGIPLEEAVASEGRRVPEHVRCLLGASVASGRFSEVLQQLVTLERNRLAMRRRLRLMLAYPALLLVAVFLLFVFLSVLVVPQFQKVFADFGAALPAMTLLILNVFNPRGAVVVLAVVAALALAAVSALGLRSRVPWVQRALYLVPLLGPCWRFRGLAEFSRILGLLVDLNVPLPQALRAVGGGLRESDLRAACRGLAEMVETGVPLSDALARFRQFPRTFRPLFQWGERTPAMAEALRGTTEMCEGRLRFQSRFMEAVLLPFVFLLVVGTVGFMVIGLFLPLISLIQHLS